VTMVLLGMGLKVTVQCSQYSTVPCCNLVVDLLFFCSGSLEFVVPATDPTSSPIEVRFTSPSTYCDVKVSVLYCTAR